MNFRFKLPPTSGFLTSGLLTGIALATVTASTAMVGCSREELAPWFPQDLRIDCQEAPPATVGQPFEWDLAPTGGVEPLTWEAEGLPAGLSISDEGVISGTPTESGSFGDLRISVTDGDGNVTLFSTCGKLVVDEPDRPVIECIDESGSIPDGFVGVAYSFEVSAPGGATPYTWEATNLPPGLSLTPNASGTSATISGTPTTKGQFGVDILVTDANGEVSKESCGDLIISDPLSVDTDELLAAFPDGCVPLGVTLQQLKDDGIIFGGNESPITCELKPGRGNGSGNFDKDPETKDTHPPGLSLNGDCAVTGKVSGSLPFGIYAFITTFSQSGLNAYVPYCAPQTEQAPSAYDIIREDLGTDATFKPGLQILDPGEAIAYGTDAPDPRVTVTDDVGACDGNTCFYAFVFAYNTLSSMSTVSANPNSKFPAQGFDGFTHAIRVTDPPLDIFSGRAYVTNITFDYCIAGNGDDCGNNEPDSAKRGELVRANGGGSNYYFSLVALPAN